MWAKWLVNFDEPQCVFYWGNMRDLVRPPLSCFFILLPLTTSCRVARLVRPERG